MKSKVYILIAAVVLTSFSCEKLKPTHTIEGFLYYSCSKNPIMYHRLELRYHRGGFSGSGTFDVTSTDNKGYFKLEYKPKSVAQMYIPTLLDDIPLEPHIDLGELYRKDVGEVKILLEVNNTYSNLDTLYVTVNGHSSYDIVLPGPFITSSIGTVEVLNNRERYPPDSAGTGFVAWHINEINKFNFEKKSFDIHGCGVVDSVSIEI